MAHVYTVERPNGLISVWTSAKKATDSVKDLDPPLCASSVHSFAASVRQGETTIRLTADGQHPQIRWRIP
jgi:hypothetical protein